MRHNDGPLAPYGRETAVGVSASFGGEPCHLKVHRLGPFAHNAVKDGFIPLSD